MRRQGRIVEWNDSRGFGFVLWHGGDERAFAHISEFSDRGARPTVGDVITYDVTTDGQGRVKASGIRYAGAAAVARQRSPRNADRYASRRSKWSGAVLLVAMLAGVGSYLYDQREQRVADAAAATAYSDATSPWPSSRAAGFQCTGKQHCSEMSSCAEARYYVAHCPDTKMDGDSDGRPCEDMCR